MRKYYHTVKRQFIASWLLLAVFLLLGGCSSARRTADKMENQAAKDSCQEMQQENAALKHEGGTAETQQQEPQNTENTEEISAEKMEDKIPESRIVCWGDSLTYGQGGNGVTYPNVLAEKTGMEVLNYGIQGETARQIAIRMGLLPMTAGAFEIPAETVPTEITLWQGGEDPIMMRLGDCAINPCVIGGVEGTISYCAEDNKYYFVRTVPGEAVSAAEQTAVETFASRDRRQTDIAVIFAGTNLPPDRNTAGELVEIEQQMIQYLGTDRYLVLGLTSKTLIPDIEFINEKLSEAFGEHFLDIRAYLLEHGLSDAGKEPSDQDLKDLAAGEIPSGIRVDEVHGNEDFYRIIGEQVYQKLEELGYLQAQ